MFNVAFDDKNSQTQQQYKCSCWAVRNYIYTANIVHNADISYSILCLLVLVSTGTHSNILFQSLAGHLLELLLDLNHVNFTPRHHHPHQCIVVSAHPLHRLLELVRKVGCLVPHTSD